MPPKSNLNLGPQVRHVMAQMSPVPVVDVDETGKVAAVGLLRIVAKDELGLNNITPPVKGENLAG